MKFDDISYNFSIAKVLAILMVAAGHFFGGLLWIPTTFALFIFAFSSGYFTARKYCDTFRIGTFWKVKIARLFLPLLVIDLFLLMLFVMQDKTNLLVWQTVPSLFGLSGFLTWFGIENPSPYGAGLWFFTLLVVFYLVYPLIQWLNRSQRSAVIFLAVSLLLSTTLQYSVPMGHMLWLTAFGFILGSYVGQYNTGLGSPVMYVVLVLLSCLALVALKFWFNESRFNYPLILLCSVGLVGFLLNQRLPNLVLKNFLLLSGSVLQIYFIHTYLFFEIVAENSPANFIISLCIIISASIVLSNVSNILSRLINGK